MEMTGMAVHERQKKLEDVNTDIEVKSNITSKEMSIFSVLHVETHWAQALQLLLATRARN